MKKFAKISVVTIMAVITALCAVGCFFAKSSNRENLPDSIDSAKGVVFNVGVTDRQKMDKIDAIEKVQRSVVAISMPSSENNTVSYGSGVIINVQRLNSNNQNADSENVFYILTCHHVIEEKGEINVFIPDAEGDNWGESDYDYSYAFSGKIGGTFNQAVTLIGGDVTSDIAVLRLDISDSNISKDDIVKAELAPTTGYTMKVGEDVFAIGNPSGTLPGSVTVGTIGYINREVSITGIGEMTLVQLNVDIYHGSSGGALFNMYGELIGITNSGSDKYIGIGYAVPFIIDATNGNKDNGFINIASQLLGTYTGKNFGYISGRLEKFGFTAQVNSNDSSIIEVSAVTIGSQAYGLLEVGDVIESVKVSKALLDQDNKIYYQDGETIEVNALQDITQAVQSLKNADKIEIKVTRTEFIAREVCVTLTARQLIFCDTGVYPSAK